MKLQFAGSEHLWPGLTHYRKCGFTDVGGLTPDPVLQRGDPLRNPRLDLHTSSLLSRSSSRRNDLRQSVYSRLAGYEDVN